jgi:hypothetical protein
MKDNPDSLEMLDALADEAARYELEEGKPTPASRAAAARYRSFIDVKLVAARRADLEALGEVKVERREIRKDLQPLPRPSLLARLGRLQERCPALGFAFNKLTEYSDDDLRTMIEDAEEELENVS